MGEDVAAKRLDQREALAGPGGDGERGADRPLGQARENRVDQVEALD